MKLTWMLCVMAAWAGSARAQSGATVEGTVRFPAERPGSAAYARYQLPRADAAKPPPPMAVVYLEGKFPAPTTTNRPAAEMAQRNFQFIPRLLPVQKGARVAFPNYDEDYHNVLSYSKAKEFDLGRYRKQEKAPAVLFDEPGVVELDCEIHAHMRATILILETPHFATTDPTGKYRLTGLPSGRYTLKAWLNPKTTWSRPVELTEGAVARVDFAAP